MKKYPLLLVLGWLLAVSQAVAQSNDPPANLVAAAQSSTQIKLTWQDKSVDETGFEIDRSLDGRTNWQRDGSAGVNAVTYLSTGLSPNTKYFYRVRAVLPRNTYTAYATANTTTLTTPPVATDLTLTIRNSTTVELTWTVVGKEPLYNVERRTGSGRYERIGTGSGFYADKNLTPGQQYCYRVQYGESVEPAGYSNEPCITIPLAPSNVRNLAAKAINSGSIRLTWDRYGKESGIEIQRRLGQSGAWERATLTLADGGEYIDNGRAANTQYCYRILEDGHEPSATVCEMTPAPPATIPRPPSSLSAAVVSFQEIRLTWADNSSDESSFDLERSTDGVKFDKIQDIPANQTSFNDQGLQARTRYYYRLLARNSAGPSTYSNTVEVTTPDGPPAAPSNLVATATSPTQITLAWADGSDNETGFRLEQSTDGGNSWTKLADIPANQTTYAVNNLTPATRYVYRIQAVNAVGASGYSRNAEATTPDKPLTPPAPPVSLSATATTASQIVLAWADRSDNETGFEIERSPDGSTGWSKVGDAPVNTPSFTDNSVKPNTTYFYRVRAVNTAGKSDASNPASATTPDVPPAPPTSLTATPTSATQVTLTWVDGSTNETGFVIQRGDSQTGAFSAIGEVAANIVTYQDGGLTPARSYCYRVVAKNAIGSSAPSSAVCVTLPDVPPAAPARLTATATGPNQVTLAWADGSGNESGFEIERGSSTTGTFTKIGEVGANSLTYDDRTVADNTTYCYRVRAKNAAGFSGFTDPACATTPLAPPAVPTNLTAQIQDYDQVRLTWDALPPKAVTVIIERSTDPTSGFVEIRQQPAGQTGYVDVGLQEFTTYYYRIRAVNAAGSSGTSNVATARIEEIIIAVEDELAAHTSLFVNQKTLYVATDWFQTSQAIVRLLTSTGQLVLTDGRRVKPADSWHYDLDQLPAGIYILAIVADGRSLTKRIILP